MDIQPQSTQPISDDQELAKVLAGVNADADTSIEQTIPENQAPPALPVVDDATLAPVVEPAVLAPASPVVDNVLSSLKQAAIVELRPLVDKLNVSPEEKFDTYLLLIRSTDDKTLLGPAHETAKLITDETKRAQALLDIIKEIDFLSAQPAAA